MGYQSETTMNHFKYYLMQLLYTISGKIGSLFHAQNGIVNKYEYVKEKITMDNKEKALLCHKEWNGKLETVAKSKVKTREDLAIAYTRVLQNPAK